MLKLSSALFCLCLFLVGVHAQELPARVLELYKQGKTEQAIILFKTIEDKRSHLCQWLDIRLAIDVQNWKHVDTLVEDLIKGEGDLPKHQWNGALAQAIGEYYFHNKNNESAKKWFELAIKFGGSGTQDDKILFSLMHVAHQQSQSLVAQRYARLIWYSFKGSPYRFKAGLYYVQAIQNTAAAEARSVLSDMRLHSGSDTAVYEQASILLIQLLIESKPGQASRVALESMKRLGADASDVLKIWHALSAMRIDPKRGQTLVEQLPIERYPQYAAYLQQFKQSAGMQIAQKLALARQHFDGERHEQVLQVLGDMWRYNQDALELCIGAGLLPSQMMSHKEVPSATVLHIYAAAPQYEPSFDRMALIERSLKTVDAKALKNAADISLIVLGIDLKILSNNDLQALLRSLAKRKIKHEALGMLLCRIAQEAHQQGSGHVRQHWQDALLYLPSEHAWFATCAEQFALLTLRPVPPGKVVASLGPAEVKNLEFLVSSLSDVAWRGSDEANLRCRYLLSQALSQLGKVVEARICFKSLHENANNERKVRIDRALRYLAEHESRQ